MAWTAQAEELAELDAPAIALLETLSPISVPKGSVLFQPGEAVKGYVIVLSGEVDVHLLGPNGRDILLYRVIPGQSCVQSTLGLLGGGEYTAEASAATQTRLVLIPRDIFLALNDSSPGFRRLVFGAFAERMQSMMKLVEAMSFLSVDERLAALLIEREEVGRVAMTQAEIARAIGTAREVVSRRIDRLTRAGALDHNRGEILIRDRAAIEAMVGDTAF